MRALFLLIALPLLAGPLLSGCNAVARQNGDYFEAGTDIGRFQQDDQDCGGQARDYISYDARGMDGTGYDRTRAYNAVYGRCMTGRGYVPRPYSKNWLPQG